MIGIIDLGLGNIRSIINAFEFLNADCTVIFSSDDLDACDGIVLPGVGAFGMGCDALEKNNLRNKIRVSVLEHGKPVLGICLGMQLMFESSEESPDKFGLGLVKGHSKLIKTNGDAIKVPHIGWNDVHITDKDILFEGVVDPVFYFLHSYHVEMDEENIVTGMTNYGQDLSIAFSHENIYGVQFHPEKSQEPGLQLLENFYKVTENI